MACATGTTAGNVHCASALDRVDPAERGRDLFDGDVEEPDRSPADEKFRRRDEIVGRQLGNGDKNKIVWPARRIRALVGSPRQVCATVRLRSRLRRSAA
jgi:hypothetical protein